MVPPPQAPPVQQQQLRARNYAAEAGLDDIDHSNDEILLDDYLDEVVRALAWLWGWTCCGCWRCIPLGAGSTTRLAALSRRSLVWSAGVLCALEFGDRTLAMLQQSCLVAG